MASSKYRGADFALKDVQYDAVISVLAGYDTLAVMSAG
ncbi:hypothetical protein MIR68_003635 [Amoeboaphelidium protococcarum]|nr:hypothetical protein MIR68_003635 [Amoeboaphelidium protococcarum]KAI3653023.1 hypothetical protein MP228_002448 [Amoeboaphelidium protococcarum]